MNKHLIVALGTFALIMFTCGSTVKAAWFIDRTGTLIQVDGAVLGDDSEQQLETKSETETHSNTQVQSNESASTKVEGKDGGVGTTDSVDKTSERRLKELETKRELAKKKLEVEIQKREKTQEALKQKIKSKLQVEGDKLKVHQETENEHGKVIKTTDTEIEDKEGLKVEQEDGKVLEVKSEKDNHLKLSREDFHAKTDLPISIGANNELIVTRPDGTEKVVTVLPDQAAAKMRARGLTVNSDNTELVEDNGKPVYKFEGVQSKKLLGLFKWSVRKETKVSAETGEEVSSATIGSSLAKLLEKLSTN